MSSSNSSSDQLHWDSIMDVLCGRAHSLADAKRARLSHQRRVKSLLDIGYNVTLADAFARDPSFVTLILATESGAKWGDIMYDYERDSAHARIAELNKLINDKNNSGRWRLDIERRALAEQYGIRL